MRPFGRWRPALASWLGLAGCLAGLTLAGCASGRVQVPSATLPYTAEANATATLAAATATNPPSPTPEPTATAVPSPTPAPRLIQLTSGGCCVQPFWSPDGMQVWYIDRPNEAAPSGIWGIGLEGGEPAFVTDRLGLYSADRRLLAYPEGGQTIIERLETGERWVVANGGQPIVFSPDGQLIAWQAASSSVNFDRRLVSIWLANVDGSQPRKLADLTGGGISDWFPDGQRLLVTHRPSPSTDPVLAVLAVADGGLTVIADVGRVRGALLSPAGGWVAYQVVFSGDPRRDGLWVMRADGTDARRLEIYGAYRWRAEGRLLVIPLEPGAPSQRLVEVAADSGAMRALTDPAVTAFRIAGGDWALSPDGRRVAFVAVEDHNIWMVELVD